MRTYFRLNFLFILFLLTLPGTLLWAGLTLADSSFKDPLDFPAKIRPEIASRPLIDITYAGKAIVAVGSRGLIIRSEDNGKTWTQSQVPVQSDLLSVHFPTPQKGWAVGHSGVILHSSNGGKTWIKQLDGRIAADLFRGYYDNASQFPCDNSMTTEVKGIIDLNYRDGPSLPWLDVWFEDEDKGFVVGSFGLIAATTDGGKTWEPWLHRIDNNEWLNLNSILGVGEDIYIAGERGMIFKLNRKTRRFIGTDTGYTGSFFIIVGSDNTLLASGLRGVMYQSDISGTNWKRLKLPAEATVTAGTVSPYSGDIVLVNNGGQILIGDAQARSFKVIPSPAPMRYTGLLIKDLKTAVVTGLTGVRTVTVTLPDTVK